MLGVTNIRDHDWLEHFISTPDKLIAAKDPIATALYQKYNKVNMPNLRLADQDLHSLMDFLGRQSAAPEKEKSEAPKSSAVATQPAQSMP